MGEFPGTLACRKLAINVSQGLRDEMHCAGYEEESSHINRARLAESCNNTGLDKYADGQSLLRRLRTEEPVLDCDRW
jgi:hypothetical protein